MVGWVYLVVLGLPALLVAAVLGRIGLIALAALGRWLRVLWMRTWPVAPGAITRSVLESKEVTTAKGETITHYRARVAYSYTVAGRQFAGAGIRVGGEGWSPDLAETRGLVDHYPEGSSVAAYYDPARPEVARLQQAATSLWPRLAAAAGLLASLLGAALTLARVAVALGRVLGGIGGAGC